jgi:thiol-disulfide isomerase/thioredoxin
LSLFLALFVTVLVVAACGGAAPTVPPQQQASAEEAMTNQDAISDEAMAEDETMSGEAMQDDEMMAEDEDMSDEAMHDDEMMAEDEAMADETMADSETMELPNWFETELTDVNTGETFKLADFQDKVVLVETMAVWCTNCLRQQREVQVLHAQLSDQPNLVTVSLDIDPNETTDILKAHTDKNGFDWLYAVTPAEVSREIGQLYGGQFLDPPATPMLIVDPHGQAHPLPFGHKTAQSLQEALAPFLNELEA